MIKTLLFTLFATNLLFYGCQKSEAALIDTQPDAYNVSFSISRFSTKTDALTSATDSLKNFEYYIYASDGSRIHSTDKKITNLGSIIELKEKLIPGSYKFVFFSSEKPLDRHINDTSNETPGFIYANIFDVYHKVVDIKVESGGKVNQSISLDKLNSSLEFDFEDQNIPENISSMLITWNDNKYVDFNGISFTEARKQKSIQFNVGNKNKKLDKFSISIFNTSTPFTIYVTYMDTNGKYISSKEIGDVRCFKNQKTILSGYLFDSNFKEFTATVKDVTSGNDEHGI